MRRRPWARTSRPGWSVAFLNERTQGEVAGVKLVRYEPRGGATEHTHAFARTFENSVAHAEGVYRDDVGVGYVRAASYGWTLGGAVGLAYVEADVPVTPAWLADGTWEVDVAGVRHPAAVSLRPMYDPTNARVKG